MAGKPVISFLAWVLVSPLPLGLDVCAGSVGSLRKRTIGVIFLILHYLSWGGGYSRRVWRGGGAYFYSNILKICQNMWVGVRLFIYLIGE